MASSLDLLFRIQGDSTGAERALQRAEAAQRKYDLAIRSARAEMEADLARRVAAEGALREKQEKQIAEVANAERQHALMMRRAHAEMEADFAHRAESQARAAEDAARRQSEAYSKAGTALLGFGAAAAAGLALAGREAIQWESAFAGVAKTFPGSEDALKGLEQGLRDLALVLPATHEEIAAVAAAAGALGVQAPNILKFTKTMIDLGEATDDLDAETAATGLAQFMNVVGTNQNDVDRLAATLVDLGNNGASTEGQILAMAQRLAAAGKIARLTESDILGFASALTSVGIEAEAGGSAFSKVFTLIDDAVKTGNENLSVFADTAGMTASQFSQSFREDAAGAIVAFVEGLGEMDSRGQSLTGTLDELGLSDLRVKNALLSAAGAGDLMSEAIDRGSEAWEQNTALVNEVAKRYETTESQLKMTRNAIVDAGIDIGQVLLPMLRQAADAVAGLAKWFSDLPTGAQRTITAFAGIAAVGGLVVGASLKMAVALKGMQTSLAAIPGASRAAGVGLRALGAANIAAGILAVGFALERVLDIMEGHDLSTEGLEGDLVRLGAAGKATGDLINTFGSDLSDLGPQIEDAAHGFDLAIGSLGKEDGRQNIEKLDAALKNLVAGGDMDAAAESFRVIAEHAADSGVNIDELNALFPQYQEELKRAAVNSDLLAQAAGPDGVAGTLDDVKVAGQGALGPLGDLPGAMGDTSSEAEKLSPAAQDLADNFGLTADEAKRAADELDGLDSTLSGLVDKYLGNEIATNDLQQAYNDLIAEIAAAKESGEDWSFALDGTSDAALRNQDTMTDLINKNLDVVASWDKTKLTSEEFGTKLDDLKQAFIDQMVQLGFNRDEVERYAGVFDQIPRTLPLDVENQSVKDAQVEAGILQGQLKALQEPTPISVDDEPARDKADAWLNDAAHYYFVPHTVGVYADDSVARGVGSVWLNDAVHNYFVPHTVHASADDTSARTTGLSWKTFADGIFGDRTVHVDVDVDIPWDDIAWLESHLPGGTGDTRGSGTRSAGDGGRYGGQSYGMSDFTVPAGRGTTWMGGGTVINKTANLTVNHPVAEKTSDTLGRDLDMAAAVL